MLINIDDRLLDATTTIASAYLSRNAVPQGEIGMVIGDVFAKLSTLAATPPEQEKVKELELAVPIKKSVAPHAVTCLECGHSGAMLKRHLMTAHGLDEATYRQRWNLPASHPLTAPNYSIRRRELAKEHGLGRKPKNGKHR